MISFTKWALSNWLLGLGWIVSPGGLFHSLRHWAVKPALLIPFQDCTDQHTNAVGKWLFICKLKSSGLEKVPGRVQRGGPDGPAMEAPKEGVRQSKWSSRFVPVLTSGGLCPVVSVSFTASDGAWLPTRSVLICPGTEHNYYKLQCAQPRPFPQRKRQRSLSFSPMNITFILPFSASCCSVNASGHCLQLLYHILQCEGTRVWKGFTVGFCLL